MVIVIQSDTTICELLIKNLLFVSTDPDARAMKSAFDDKKMAIRQNTICKIVESCYVDIVHNIRAAAKVLPASAFFKNI